MDNLRLVVWTHPSYADVWPMFFGQLEKHAPFFDKKTVLVPHHTETLPANCVEVLNNEKEEYCKRFIESMSRVKEEHVLVMFEDFILYDDAQEEKIRAINQFLKESDYSFVRLIKSGIKDQLPGQKVSEELDLFEIVSDPSQTYIYSTQAAIWKKEHLLNLFRFFAPRTIQDSEVRGSHACVRMGMRGCYTYSGEPKRGRIHYDSSVFPYMATAITGGSLGRKACWLTSHYEQELQPLFETYNIDPAIRGTI